METSLYYREMEKTTDLVRKNGELSGAGEGEDGLKLVLEGLDEGFGEGNSFVAKIKA